MRGIFCLMLLSLLTLGCTRSSVSGSFSTGGKNASYAILGGQLYYLIVTDGELGSHGVHGYPIVGSFFDGSIYPASKALGTIEYSAYRGHMQIGGKRYRLSAGKFILVETSGPGVAVTQINENDRQQIKGLVAKYPELEAFCDPNGPSRDR